jgi:CubicO group peptidase (beta-lactamase class C family)
MEDVDNLMQRALVENVFPGGVLLVSKEDSIVFEKAYGYANIFSKQKMMLDTVFDLASLTKPLATTLAVMKLIQYRKLDLEQHLGSVLGQFEKTEKRKVKIRHLLSHSSGLPDYQPYYKTLDQIAIEKRKNYLRRLLQQEPLIYPTGKQAFYSDIGFMILEWIVEKISGMRLDLFLYQEVYGGLDLGDDPESGLFFVELASPLDSRNNKAFAATEICPWRNRLLNGAVHDENAYVMGGISGHAGLFGTARNVFSLLSKLLESLHGYSSVHGFQQELLVEFFKKQAGLERALGFDMPSAENASCGKHFSKRSIGHLGFTGTSFWVDPERSIIFILLTNRVHPTRYNMKIKTFRPVLHDTVMENF